MMENFLKEAQPMWGGSWTEKKLDAFTKYVAAYLRIMRKNPYWKTIYFDGFAGSGDRKLEKRSSLCESLSINEQEESLYKGSAERVISLPDELLFDFYYFIDSNEVSLLKLEGKLTKMKPDKASSLIFKFGDCNKWLHELALAMRSDKYAALVFLDPFGMQISWESISSLKNTRSDIWILIPTGVIVNRLLDKNCELRHSEKLQSFFGLTEEEIKDHFYLKQKHQTLFGEEERISKVIDPIEKIANLYILQMKKVWKHVTEKPLRLENSRGVPIFHFAFASNNAAAVKIAGQIIKSL
jgi:three-Cys-motif partner protein